MAVFTYFLDAPMPAECRGGAAMIGNFDGVHRGHQTLLAETIRLAKAFRGAAIAVTFDPPPTQMLHPERFGLPLTPLDHRCRLLHEHGIDHVLILRTSTELLQLEPEVFFERILRDGLRARAIVEGFNFGFGKDRRGTGAMLQALGRAAGMTVTLLPAHLEADSAISSSRVRAALLAGNVAEARQLMGRPHRLFGVVGEGQKRGRTLGFPTANLTVVKNLVPGGGVYAGQVAYQGKTWAAAIHLGPNATFGEKSQGVEVHLLDFVGDLYGKELHVDFLKKVRDTRAFGSVDELVRQIQTDIAQVRQALKS